MSRRIAAAARRAPRARAPCCSRSTASSRGARRRGELPRRRSSSSARPPRAIDAAGATAASAWAARRSRSSREERAAAPSSRASLPALRGALLADADGVVLEVDRSPAAVAFASSVRAPGGQPDRRALPGPSDQHEAQAARRRLRPGDAMTPTTLGARLPERRRRPTRTGIASYYERNVDDETRQFPIDPAGPRVVARARDRHRHDRQRRGAGAHCPRSLPPRDRRPGRGRRARRLPLAQRERGVRDRVLAARALQARAGACRAASSPAVSRSSPAARAASAAPRHGCSPSAARTSSSRDLNDEGARGGRRRARRSRTASAGHSPSPST